MSKTTIIGKNRAEVAVSVGSGVREARFQCDNRRGILEAIGVMASGQPAQVIHPKCMHREDQACRYLISWRTRFSTVWKRGSAYAGALALAVAAGTSFVLPVASWIALILVMGVVCLSLLMVGHKLENKELVEHLKEKGDAANHLIEAIEAQYQNHHYQRICPAANRRSVFQHRLAGRFYPEALRNEGASKKLDAVISAPR